PFLAYLLCAPFASQFPENDKPSCRTARPCFLSAGPVGPRRTSMAKNIYVGNLSFETTADDLIQMFSEHGTVVRAQVVSDRETGRSRGFGFVEMSDGGDAAIAALNGTQFQGRTLTVNEARPREDRPRSGGGGGGYGGGGGRPRSGGDRRGGGGGGGGYGNR